MQKQIEIIKKVLRDNVDVHGPNFRTRLSSTTSFKNDLSFDSLKFMLFVYELQELYPNLDEMSYLNWSTVGDCAKCIESYS